MKLKNIQSIDQKIKELEEKKNALLKSQSEKLLKSLPKIFGNDFSPELVLTILDESWHSANKNQKEAWLEKAQTFRSKKSEKAKASR